MVPQELIDSQKIQSLEYARLLICEISNDPFIDRISIAGDIDFFLTIINDGPNSLIMTKHPKPFKSNYGDSLTTIDVINYRLMESNYDFIADVYCQQVDEMHIQ